MWGNSQPGQQSVNRATDRAAGEGSRVAASVQPASIASVQPSAGVRKAVPTLASTPNVPHLHGRQLVSVGLEVLLKRGKLRLVKRQEALHEFARDLVGEELRQ